MIDDQENKKLYVLSYGGGVNSSALYFYIKEKKLPLDLVIFSDTGEELSSTYEAVDCMKKICEVDNVPFVRVQSKFGKLYDYYFDKKAVPSIKFRDCTSKFKIAPIRQYLRKTYGKKQKFVQYIGIAYDEMQRTTKSDVQYIELSYPFVDDGIDRKGNYEILKKYGFVASKSGCSGCMYQSKKSWSLLYKNDKATFDKWKKLEERNPRYPEITLNPNYSLKDFESVLKEQTTLNKYLDDNEEELLCSETRGGCFL